MKVNLLSIIVWMVVPILHFLLWYLYGKSATNSASCGTLDAMLADAKQELLLEDRCNSNSYSHSGGISVQCNNKVSSAGSPVVEFVRTAHLDEYRAERLGPMAAKTDPIYVENLFSAVTLVNSNSYSSSQSSGLDRCTSVFHQFETPIRREFCFAIAVVKPDNVVGTDSSAKVSDYAYNIVRSSTEINEYGVHKTKPDKGYIDQYTDNYALNDHNSVIRPATGFFRKVPKVNGRLKLQQKLEPFLQYYQDIQAHLDDKLNSHNIKAGDDLTVMVVNEGEIDLFMNFACSCKEHGISLDKVFIFAGSSEIVALIEATGAIASYHEGYAAVSKKASNDYLDKVFVDMMWYKAFSIYLILDRKINILFQDIDLVWFKDPMQYFHDQLAVTSARSKLTGSFIEAFFSDDGQRSKRYTPFYANSGFYYLLGNDRSKYFSWAIMTSFDAVQVLGSHQNVFTTKLVEGLGLGAHHVKILSLRDFPNGILYHHDEDYMKELADGRVHPYGFHMCWTQGKADKLKYLRDSKMWYLTEQCSPLKELIANSDQMKSTTRHGSIYQLIVDNSGLPVKEQWNKLGSQCCMSMAGAP